MKRHSHRFFPPSTFTLPVLSLLATLAILMSGGRSAGAQCLEEPPVQHFTGGINSVCPCFVPGEEAGATFIIPAAHFPIEVLRVGIGWASQSGGAPQSLESGLHVYGAGLPNPGPRLFTLGGPVLNDGFINVFDLHAQLGNVILNNGPVTVTLEFLNSNSGQFFAPSIGFDSGCTPGGANVVKANPGGWADACNLGVTGDWVVFMVYKQTCQSGIGEEITVSNTPITLLNPRPNPFLSSTEIEFVMAAAGEAEVSVFDIQGKRIARLVKGWLEAGPHSTAWDGRGDDGASATPGLYLVRLEAEGRATVRKVILSE